MYGPNNWSTQISGTTPAFLTVRDWQLSAGFPFADSDVRSATQVALLGQTVVENLFGDEDPVGKTIRIKNSPYVVLGVLAEKGQSLDGRDQDDTVLIPVTTAQRKLFGTRIVRHGALHHGAGRISRCDATSGALHQRSAAPAPPHPRRRG